MSPGQAASIFASVSPLGISPDPTAGAAVHAQTVGLVLEHRSR
jgi:hypothetical protein